MLSLQGEELRLKQEEKDGKCYSYHKRNKKTKELSVELIVRLRGELFVDKRVGPKANEYLTKLKIRAQKEKLKIALWHPNPDLSHYYVWENLGFKVCKKNRNAIWKPKRGKDADWIKDYEK